MSWTRPVNLREQVQKLWDRGELLSSLVTGESLFDRDIVAIDLRLPDRVIVQTSENAAPSEPIRPVRPIRWT